MDRPEQLPQRMTTLETRMTAVESQIVQLRSEMQSEFSALRTDLSIIRVEIREVDEGLTKEMRAGDEETRRLMRVLHEDVIQRIATIRGG